MVMLPLALAYGVAAGLGALAGLYGAIALGFLAAVVGGTRTMISGPTALMAVTTTAVIANHADTLAEVFTITMLAGVFQVLLGLARLGRFIAYAPYSVISGFMTGIGVIIIVMQTRPLVGLPVEGGGVLATLGTWRAAWGGVEWTALVLAGVALGSHVRVAEEVPALCAADVRSGRCGHACRRILAGGCADYWERANGTTRVACT